MGSDFPFLSLFSFHMPITENKDPGGADCILCQGEAAKSTAQ